VILLLLSAITAICYDSHSNFFLYIISQFLVSSSSVLIKKIIQYDKVVFSFFAKPLLEDGNNKDFPSRNITGKIAIIFISDSNPE